MPPKDPQVKDNKNGKPPTTKMKGWLLVIFKAAKN
jgi:hypothetical protein